MWVSWKNGNGKTTLLTILALLNKTSGEPLSTTSRTTQRPIQSKIKISLYTSAHRVWYGKVDNLKDSLVHHRIKGEENELHFNDGSKVWTMEIQNLKWKELSSGYKMRFELENNAKKTRGDIVRRATGKSDILAQQVILEGLRCL